jgi:hypothetical protein
MFESSNKVLTTVTWTWNLKFQQKVQDNVLTKCCKSDVHCNFLYPVKEKAKFLHLNQPELMAFRPLRHCHNFMGRLDQTQNFFHKVLKLHSLQQPWTFNVCFTLCKCCMQSTTVTWTNNCNQFQTVTIIWSTWHFSSWAGRNFKLKEHPQQLEVCNLSFLRGKVPVKL